VSATGSKADIPGPCTSRQVITAALCEQAATAVARSQCGELVVLSLCAADDMATAATVIAATVSVQRQWVLLRSAQLRRERITAVGAATMPTVTGFARTGTTRTERRDLRHRSLSAQFLI
jgi:hypothetical protein